MKIYLKRIQQKILPFILIGFLTKLLFLFQGNLLKLRWLRNYLRYADMSLNLKLRSFQLFGEFIAPTTIAYCLIFLYVLAGLHGIIAGRKTGEGGSFFASRVILPIEDFVSSLSIITLGLVLGIAVGAIPSGVKTVATFLAFGLYPLFFLMFLAVGVGFVYVRNKTIVNAWLENRLPGFIKTRLDGVYLLSLFMLAITYHTVIREQIRTAGKWMLGLL